MTGLAVLAGQGMVVLAMALALIRLWRGPTMADRVVALDMMSAALIAFCGLYVLRADAGAAAWLDIAVTMALIGFVPVIAFARYAGMQARRSDSKTGAKP